MFTALNTATLQAQDSALSGPAFASIDKWSKEEQAWEKSSNLSTDRQEKSYISVTSDEDIEVEMGNEVEELVQIETSQQIRKRHNNKVGSKDHTFRVDVRGKSFLRNLIKVVKLHFLSEVKGSGKCDKMFKLLRKLLEEQYSSLKNNDEFFFKIYSPILFMILRKKDENIRNSSYFSEKEKQIILQEINLFKSVWDDFSIAHKRRELYKHPIIRLSKTLIYNNDIYKKKFWKRVLDTRRKKINDVDSYMKILEKDLESYEMII